MRRSPSRPVKSRRMPPFPYVQDNIPHDTSTYLHTTQAKSHGNEPSKGAKIDQQIAEEEAAELAKKGSFGPSN